MPAPMRIVSRDAFAAVLGEATTRTQQLAPPRWPLLREISAQLEFMATATADGRVPNADERRSTSVGPLAARNLEEVDPTYADQLEELDYTFRRYHLLPAGPAVQRRGILQVWSGPEAYRKLVLAPGERFTVGSASPDAPAASPSMPARTPPHGTTTHAPVQPPVHLQVRADPPLAPVHFEVLWDGVAAHVRALGPPHPITIDGLPAFRGELAHRGWMTAARTTFRFIVEARTPPSPPRPPTAASTAVLATLAPLRAEGTLYAIVDAARSARALEVVEESVDPHASLYDGERGRAFDDVAPYLVQLDRSSDLLERLVHEGWGEAWGIFLKSSAGFEAVRRHLRQFLLVEAEGEPHRLFFRFYDPRVLRTFAEVITPEQRAELMARLDALMYEDAAGELASLRPTASENP